MYFQYRIFRKVLSVIVFILLVAVLFAGCQKSEYGIQNGDASNKKVSSKEKIAKEKESGKLPDKLTNLNISILANGPTIASNFAEPIKIFEAKYNAKVNVDITTNEEYDAKVITAMAAGDIYDCIWMSPRSSLLYPMKNIAQSINDYVDLQDPLWDIDYMNNFKYKNKYYGVSSGIAPNLIIFNKTLFENNGIKTPIEYYKEGKWDWDTFENVGIKLTQDTNGDGATDQWGYFSPFIDHFISTNGADFVDIKDDGSITLKLDKSIMDVLQFLSDACNKYKFICLSGNWAILFKEGKIAMTSNRILPAYEQACKDAKFEWGFAPMPYGSADTKNITSGTGALWGIGNGAKNPEGGAALLYIAFKTWKENSPDKMNEVLNAEQLKFYEDYIIKTNIRTANYIKIGDMQSIAGKLYVEIRRGAPVNTTLEKYRSLLQDEIDKQIKQ